MENPVHGERHQKAREEVFDDHQLPSRGAEKRAHHGELWVGEPPAEAHKWVKVSNRSVGSVAAPCVCEVLRA